MQNQNLPFHAYNTHIEALEAVQLLDKSGFDVKKVSLVGRGYHSEEHPIGFYTQGDRIKTWGGIGAAWGGIWGVLFAPAMFFVPGLGLLALAGPVVAALISALEGAVVVGGLSALGAALTQIGLSNQHAIKYETALKADQYVLLVHGSADDVAEADAILGSAVAWKAAQSRAGDETMLERLRKTPW